MPFLKQYPKKLFKFLKILNNKGTKIQKYELNQDSKQYIFSTFQLVNKLITSYFDNSSPNQQIFKSEFIIEEICLHY